jgi:hypothetical protein
MKDDDVRRELGGGTAGRKAEFATYLVHESLRERTPGLKRLQRTSLWTSRESSSPTSPES